MYCTVYTTGYGSVIYINPNCNMKLIYEYLRVVTEVPDSKEIDLCTDFGRLLGIYEAPCSASGLQYLTPRDAYFIFTFDYIEKTGELYNPQAMMHYTNQDFDAVFSRIRKFFAIPLSEPIDDEDASLIYEHLLLAYQEKNQPEKPNLTKKKSSSKRRSFSVSIVDVRRRSKGTLESLSVLAQWREEKQIKLASLRIEESEGPFPPSSSVSILKSTNDELKAECAAAEEAAPEYLDLEVPPEQKSTIASKKRASQMGKKGTKKQNKKSAKEEAKLLKTAPSTSQKSVASKQSVGVVASESGVQLLRLSSSTDTGNQLKTLCRSKSTIFTESGYHGLSETFRRRPYDSIRQFFREHPTDYDVADLPKPPEDNTDKSKVSEGTEKLGKTKKKRVVRKKHKIVYKSIPRRQTRHQKIVATC